jgi:DNA-binding NtrC family response regulator
MKKVLVVDDEPQAHLNLRRALRRSDAEWDIRFLESGRQALESMNQDPADAFIADALMPEINGAELLAEIRRSFPSAVRILMSGGTPPEALLRLTGAAHQCLTKPVHWPELQEAVERSLALRDLLDNEPLRQFISRLQSLPSLPALYTELDKELRSDCPSLDLPGFGPPPRNLAGTLPTVCG